ncbi:response regulator transcription factor [bacterium]|nr:response regulator transcription factor [bacterium]
MEEIKIFITDDNTDFRDRVRALVDKEKNLVVAGEAPDANHIINEVMASGADVVLLDVSMPGMNGLEAARTLKERMPGLKIILVSVYDIEEYREAALTSGAFGYLVKKDVMNELVPLIWKAVVATS